MPRNSTLPRRRRRSAGIYCLLLATAAALAEAQETPHPTDTTDTAAVRQVLLDAYVSGVHVERDTAAVRAGFHPDFVMLVDDAGRLLSISLDDWLDRMQLDGVPTSDIIRHEFRAVDVTEDAAMAVLEIYENGVHIYTDYFSLYRFTDGWRIVSKIFHGH